MLHLLIKGDQHPLPAHGHRHQPGAKAAIMAEDILGPVQPGQLARILVSRQHDIGLGDGRLRRRARPLQRPELQPQIGIVGYFRPALPRQCHRSVRRRMGRGADRLRNTGQMQHTDPGKGLFRQILPLHLRRCRIGPALPQISFCPTGGITPGNVQGYLNLANVVCAGGSWIAPQELVSAGDWSAIRALARAAAQLPA